MALFGAFPSSRAVQTLEAQHCLKREFQRFSVLAYFEEYGDAERGVATDDSHEVNVPWRAKLEWCREPFPIMFQKILLLIVVIQR